ncbi:MAG: hypothetical protein IPO09_15485 [Anaeromyxobacter sp.]|nr:hypothetical protein [Anaeromyxobacter sp.]
MHLAGLSGMANDIAFLQGAASYGRLRTTVINTSMLVCGSRFGRGWVRPASIRAPLAGAHEEATRANLALLARDIRLVDQRLRSSASVRHRLEGVGTVTREQALEIGLVGQAARASGVDLDLRARRPGACTAPCPSPRWSRPAATAWRGRRCACARSRSPPAGSWRRWTPGPGWRAGPRPWGRWRRGPWPSGCARAGAARWSTPWRPTGRDACATTRCRTRRCATGSAWRWRCGGTTSPTSRSATRASTSPTAATTSERELTPC